MMCYMCKLPCTTTVDIKTSNDEIFKYTKHYCPVHDLIQEDLSLEVIKYELQN